MTESLVRHFDVIVVIWVLALCVGFAVVSLSHSPLGYDQGSGWAQVGPDWVVSAGNN